MSDSTLHIKMATQLMKSYESGEVSLANTVRQIHYWVKSCPEAYAIIPLESPVAAELQKFQSYRRQLGIDLLSIDCIVVRTQISIPHKLPLRTLLLSCVGNATVVIEDGTRRSEYNRHVGLSTYGRMERAVIELCKAVTERQPTRHSFELDNYNETTLSLNSGEGFRQVASWRYATDLSPVSPFLIEVMRLTDEIVSACVRGSAETSTPEETG